MKVVSLILLGATLIFFQNCESGAQFSKNNDPSTAGSSGNAVLPPGVDMGEVLVDEGSSPGGALDIPLTPIDPTLVDMNCMMAKTTKTIRVEFPDPGRTCSWNEDGNLGPRNQYFQARIEQRVNLGLPANSIICDASFDFAQQDFRYDDHFMLLFNKSVIAASYDWRAEFEAKAFGLLEYNWQDIRGMYWDGDDETIFCPQIPGYAASCSFPGHDTQGVVQLAYDSKYIKAVMANGLPQDHSFSVVSIGDNDGRDCEHSDMAFDVTVQYVIKQ